LIDSQGAFVDCDVQVDVPHFKINLVRPPQLIAQGVRRWLDDISLDGLVATIS
jgi:hypothetical protein